MPSIDISTLPGIVDVGPLSDIMSFSDDSDATAVDILNGDAISGDNEFEHVKIAHGENAKDDEILDPKPKSKAPYRIPLTKLSSQILPIATIRSASKKVPKEVMTPRTAPPTPTPRLTQPAQTPGIKNLRKEDELLNGAEIDDDMDFDLTTRSDTDSEYNDESQRARIRSLVAEKAEKASAKKVKKLFGAENDREKPANTKETKEPTTKPTRKSKPKANPKPAVIESAVLDDEIHGGDEDLGLSDRMTNRSNETPAPAPKATQVSSSKIAAAVAETKDMDPIVPIDSRRKTVPQTSAKKVVDKLHKRRKVAPHLEPRSRYTKYPEYVDDKLENGIRIENQYALNLHQDLDVTLSDHIPDSLFPQSSTHSSDDSYSGKAFSQKLLQAVGKSKLQASKKRNLIELGKRLGLGAGTRWISCVICDEKLTSHCALCSRRAIHNQIDVANVFTEPSHSRFRSTSKQNPSTSPTGSWFSHDGTKSPHSRFHDFEKEAQAEKCQRRLEPGIRKCCPTFQVWTIGNGRDL